MIQLEEEIQFYINTFSMNKFLKFYEEWQKSFPNYEKPVVDFLNWFIGFTEGDGCFCINKRRELSFIITQGEENIDLLNFIHKTLRIGHVIKQGSRTFRFIVYRKEHIYLIILLFNGNIVLPTRKIQFNQFLLVYSQKTKDHVEYLTFPNTISLSNTWLLGFVEAEGCFTISFLSNSISYRTRFILSQKGDINVPILSQLILLFSTGTIEAHSAKDNYSYIVSGLKNVKLLYGYFDKYKFYGIKGESYLRFKSLNAKIDEGEHLDLSTRKELQLLSHFVNRKIK